MEFYEDSMGFHGVAMEFSYALATWNGNSVRYFTWNLLESLIPMENFTCAFPHGNPMGHETGTLFCRIAVM